MLYRHTKLLGPTYDTVVCCDLTRYSHKGGTLCLHFHPERARFLRNLGTLHNDILLYTRRPQSYVTWLTLRQ
jgi:hypothetical protein